jgi:hypothetical protein
MVFSDFLREDQEYFEYTGSWIRLQKPTSLRTEGPDKTPTNHHSRESLTVTPCLTPWPGPMFEVGEQEAINCNAGFKELQIPPQCSGTQLLWYGLQNLEPEGAAEFMSLRSEHGNCW